MTRVRPATEADVPLVLRFIRELAEYERGSRLFTGLGSPDSTPCVHVHDTLQGFVQMTTRVGNSPCLEHSSGETGELWRLAGQTRKGLACRRCPARLECVNHADLLLQGYELPRSGRAMLREWRRTRPVLSAFTAARDIVSIFAASAAHLLLVEYSFWLAVAAYLPLLVLISRMLRGLEVLVHEGSHYNWVRRRATNDFLVDIFAGLPVFQTVRGYRVAHAIHHKHFGTQEDPCRKRFMAFRWGTLARMSAVTYTQGMIGSWLPYWTSWRKLVGGNRRAVGLGFIWHFCFFVVPLAVLIQGVFDCRPGECLALAIFAWLAYVGISYVLVLPTLRFIAEASEHDYGNGTTTRTGNYHHVKPLHWILHPHGDGYHFLHHVDPNIPHHRLRAIHVWLTRNDPEYASTRTRGAQTEPLTLNSNDASA